MDSMLAPSPWGRVPQHRQGRQHVVEKRSQCNCRNSRCLKLYCECFASGQYCFGCNCQGCHNNPENNDKRVKAIDVTLERNPSAFRPKIALETSNNIDAGKHSKGCHCKKSGCLKKYCECFQAGITCMASCKCSECKNQPDNDERIALEQAGKVPLPSAKNAEMEEESWGAPSSSSAVPVLVAQMNNIAPAAATAADRARAGIASYVTEGWLAIACHEMLEAAMKKGRQRNRVAATEEREHEVLSVLHGRLKELVDVADTSSLAGSGVPAVRDGERGGGAGKGKRKAS